MSESGFTDEQQVVVDTPFARDTVYVVIAPAGCGKSTVANQIALNRIAWGLRGHVVYSYNATGKAMLKPFAPSLETGALSHGTFHQFARMVSHQCHLDTPSGPCPDLDLALASIMADTELARRLGELKGVFKARQTFSSAPPQVKLPSLLNQVSALTNGVQPPECMTWEGMAARWRAAGCTGRRAWLAYADAVLQPLGLWGSRDALDASGGGPVPAKRPLLLTPYDFVRDWLVVTMVTRRLYDPYLNVHRLELAWFPHRFDFVRGMGLFDFLIVDEAQDVPGAESVYLPVLLRAWACEAWFAGDPHQELYTFMNTVNMLRTLDAPTAKFTLATNFRVPSPVWAAAEKHVLDLPHAVLVQTEGEVEYLPVPPRCRGLRGAVVLFRGNQSLVTFAAQHMLEEGQAARVSRHCFQKVQQAWSTWKAAPHLCMDASPVQDADDSVACRQAFQGATGAALRVFASHPTTWLVPEEDGVDAAAPTSPPLLSTVHGFKGQGHPDVVLMPGIVPVRGKCSVDTPEGRLAYTAITRCSHRLRIVITGKRVDVAVKNVPE